MSVQKTIIAGPDKFSIATRLFEGNNKEQRPVFFRIKEGDEHWSEFIKLNSAEREDGSGESWNMTGYNVANNCRVSIYYNLKTRQGRITFG